MLMNLPASELKSILPGLSRVFPKPSTKPAMQGVRIIRDPSSNVCLTVTDLNLFASYRLEQPVPGEQVDVLIPFDSLQRTVKACQPGDEVETRISDDGIKIIHPLGGRRIERSVASLDLHAWPEIPQFQAEPDPLPEDFNQAVAVALECCSADEGRGALEGAWIDVSDPKAHYVMGTDGRHLHASNSFTLGLKKSLLLPKSRFLQWSGFQNDGPWKLAVQPGDPGWARIDSNRWSFCMRLPEHDIPNWRQVIPGNEQFKSLVRFSNESTRALLDILPRLPGKDTTSSPVLLDVNPSGLVVSGADKEDTTPTAIPIIDVTIEGPPVRLTLNREFLLKALKWGLTTLHIIDSLAPVVFTAPGRKLVAMPLRTEEAMNSAPTNPQPEAPHAPQPQPQPEPAEPQEEPMKNRITGITTPPPPPPVVEEARPRAASTTPAEAAATLVPPLKAAIKGLDSLKDMLKAMHGEAAEVGKLLGQVVREKRMTDREVEAVREKLRDIQSVRI